MMLQKEIYFRIPDDKKYIIKQNDNGKLERFIEDDKGSLTPFDEYINDKIKNEKRNKEIVTERYDFIEDNIIIVTLYYFQLIDRLNIV